LALLAAIAAGTGSAAGAQDAPAKTRIEAQLVGPADPNAQFSVSRHGAHAATVVAKGSRVAVLVDGVEGPRFDEILPIANPGGEGRVSFSPDGTRSAYVGRQGQELVVMVDGKEMLRVPTPICQIQGPFNLPGPAFTTNGKHVYWVLYTQKPDMTGGTYFQFYYDGVPGPHGNDSPAVFFSPSGDRYAYMLTNPVNREQHALLVDGKPAGYPPAGYQVQEEFRFTGDDAHLFIKTGVPRMGALQLFVDGKPFLRAGGARLYQAPVGNAFATVVQPGSPGGPAAEFIDIAGKKVPGSEGTQIDSIRWSPDGKHWAAKVTTAARSMFVIADGKKGLEYTYIGEIAFTATGTVVYTATNAGKGFVIVGDQESDGYPGSTYGADPIPPAVPKGFMIAGTRVGYMANTAAGGFDRLAVVDGKVWSRRRAQDLTLSPDGSRFAFMFEGGVNLDGTDVPWGGLIQYKPAMINQWNMPPARFLFSPDSKHLVAFGQSPNGAGILVDGRFLLAGNGSPYSPTFTPDGRHLFWKDHLLNDSHWAVFLDGQPVVMLDQNFARLLNYPGAWEMGTDGVLTLIGATEEGVKRFRITPGSDTSIETLLAKAGRRP
jgi:hypothetical protein